MTRQRRAVLDLDEAQKASQSRLASYQSQQSVAEATINGLQLRGLIDQTEQTDALILLRREAATAQLQELDAQKSIAEQLVQTDQGRADQHQRELRTITEQIAATHNLGAELTAQEAAQQRISQSQILRTDRAQRTFLDYLSRQKGITEAVADSMIAAYEGVAGALDRGIDRLTAKIGIFGSVISGVLKSIARSILTNLFAPLAGGSGGGGSSGGGGILGSIVNLITGGGRAQSGGGGGSGVSGGGAAGGGTVAQILSGLQSGGGSFLTPGFAGGSVASITGAAGGSGGSGGSGVLDAAQFFGSLTGGGAGGGPQQSLTQQALQSASIAANYNLPGLSGGIGGGAGVSLASGGLKGLLGNAAFAAPLLGLSLGASLGGKSTLGSILGGAGGLLLGGSLLAGVGGAGAIGGLLGLVGVGGTNAAILSSALTGLLTNPFTIAAGVALLVGAYFLGKSKQRKSDEKLADSYWVAEADQLKILTKEVNADQIDGQSALAQAAQLRQQTIAQLNTIKTSSVRESRLRNQLADVDRVYVAPLKAAVEAQTLRTERKGKIVPTFADGGIVPGVYDGRDSVLARLSGGEVVLTPNHQHQLFGALMERVGVPGFGGSSAMPPAAQQVYQAAGQPIYITNEMIFALGKEDQTKLVAAGLQNNKSGVMHIVRSDVRRKGKAGLAGDLASG